MAGIRVVTFSPNGIAEIEKVISQEFKILERSDKGEKLIAEERFGYNSVHYLVKLSDKRESLPEYERFKNLVAEVQIRTILQHAWAEIEHDIQYKSTSVIPIDIHRRFIGLAGMLEVADREFQAVQDEDKRLRQEVRQKIREGEIDEVEITPDALKTFMTERFGVDKRISWFTYDYLARMLRKCGFVTLRQVEVCTDGYDDDALSQLAYGFRQGQSVRFQLVILAGMGELFIQRHPLADDEWFQSHGAELLEKYRQNKIEVRRFDPLKGSRN